MVEKSFVKKKRRYSGKEGRIHTYILFSVLYRLGTRQTANIIAVLGSAL